jgi:hypothetical protein
MRLNRFALLALHALLACLSVKAQNWQVTSTFNPGGDCGRITAYPETTPGTPQPTSGLATIQPLLCRERTHIAISVIRTQTAPGNREQDYFSGLKPGSMRNSERNTW